MAGRVGLSDFLAEVKKKGGQSPKCVSQLRKKLQGMDFIGARNNLLVGKNVGVKQRRKRAVATCR